MGYIPLVITLFTYLLWIFVIALQIYRETNRHSKKPGHFWAKCFPVNFSLCPVYLFAKRIRFLPPLVFL